MAQNNRNSLLDIFNGVIDDVIDNSDFLSEKLGTVVENRNMEALKKKERRNGNYLYVTRQENIGEGVYTVVDKHGEEVYHTLPTFGKSHGYTLHFYDNYGEIADITKRRLTKGGFFNKLVEDEYYYRSNEYPPGAVIQVGSKDKKKYITEFNSWMVMGDFVSGNYNFFDQDTGQAIASISRRFKNAATYSVLCREGEDEPVIIFMTILIDMIEKV